MRYINSLTYLRRSTKLLHVEPVSSETGDRSYCLGMYVTRHPGQLNLLPSAGWEMSTGQKSNCYSCHSSGFMFWVDYSLLALLALVLMSAPA